MRGRVKPDLIRLGSDEVTYPAHVTLRYRLERALISGDLVLDDLPVAWNDGMKNLLGLDVPSDREGCLQDGHWYEGVFGYFPCYSLGAMALIPTRVTLGNLMCEVGGLA
jgi:carboxypeptidase Taq